MISFKYFQDIHSPNGRMCPPCFWAQGTKSYREPYFLIYAFENISCNTRLHPTHSIQFFIFAFKFCAGGSSPVRTSRVVLKGSILREKGWSSKIRVPDLRFTI